MHHDSCGLHTVQRENYLLKNQQKWEGPFSMNFAAFRLSEILVKGDASHVDPAPIATSL